MDQKKTKRMVRIVSLLAGIAFVGVLPVVLIVIIAGGGDTTVDTSPDARIIEAQRATQATPRNAAAWDELAAAFYDAMRYEESARAGERAVRLAPKNDSFLTTYLSALTADNQTDRAVTEAQRFTRANPENPEGFFLLGEAAQGAGRTALARLSYQQVINLDPGGIRVAEAEAALQQLSPTTAQTAPTAPTDTTGTTPTTTAPITP